MVNVAEDKAKHNFPTQAGQLTQKMAEEALTDIFSDVFVKADSGFKRALYYFIEDILTEILSGGSPGDMMESSLEHWTQLPSFINGFIQDALELPRFVGPSAKFIRKNFKNRPTSTEQKERIIDNLWILADFPTSLLKSPGEHKWSKHGRHQLVETKKHWMKERRTARNLKGIKEDLHLNSKVRWALPFHQTQLRTPNHQTKQDSS